MRALVTGGAGFTVRVSVARPDFDADVNVVGTVRILESAREHAAQIVFSSWRAERSLEEGLRETWEWISAQ